MFGNIHPVRAPLLAACLLVLVGCNDSTVDPSLAPPPQFSLNSAYYIYASTSDTGLQDAVRAAATAWDGQAFHGDDPASSAMPNMNYGAGTGAMEVRFTKNSPTDQYWCGAYQGSYIQLSSGPTATSTCPLGGVDPRMVSDVEALVLHEMTHWLLDEISHSFTPMLTGCISSVPSYPAPMNTNICVLERQRLYLKGGLRSTSPEEWNSLAETFNGIPSTESISATGTYTYTASWEFADPGTDLPTSGFPTLTWSIGDTNVVQVNSSSGMSAVIGAVAVGQTTVTVGVSSITSVIKYPFTEVTSTITVGPVDTIIVSPASVTADSMSSYQAAVTAQVKSNGSIVDARNVQWRVDDGSVAGVLGSGSSATVYGNHTGTTTLRASIAGFPSKTVAVPVTITCPAHLNNYCP